MTSAGFLRGADPGAWLSPDGVPVDLMIPESMSDPGGRRGGRVPPHSRRALRRASGLEAAIVDHAPIVITALDPDDRRSRTINVAGPGALLVAKLHKLGERNDRNPERLNDKDAHDVYRLLVSIQTTALAGSFARLLTDDISAAATRVALEHLDKLFARGADARGSQMAGRAEGQLGAPEIVAQSVAALAADLSQTIGRPPRPERRGANALHKLGDRNNRNPERLNDRDAHDVAGTNQSPRSRFSSLVSDLLRVRRALDDLGGEARNSGSECDDPHVGWCGAGSCR